MASVASRAEIAMTMTKHFRAPFRGDDLLTGTSGNDHLLGYRGDDTFDLTAGGEDIAEGGGGNDIFLIGSSLSVGDRFYGGAGREDTLVLQGTKTFTFAAGTMTGVEKIDLLTGGEYYLRFDPATVTSRGLTIDGSGLGDHENMSIAMTSATTKKLFVWGGASEDTLMGSDGNDALHSGDGYDTLTGGGGADLLEGGALADCFHYHAATDSMGLKFDTIADFHQSEGDMLVVPFAFGHVGAAVTAGHLNTATFESDLVSQITDAQLGAHGAVLFTPNSGGFGGDTFVVVDFNDVAGYQAGEDVVIRLQGAIGLFNDDAFIGA